MTNLQAAALVVGLILAAGTLPLLIVRLLWRRRPRVLVVLKSGETVAGVLLHRRPTYLVVGGATIAESTNQTPITVDGALYVDRSNVRWVQTPER